MMNRYLIAGVASLAFFATLPIHAETVNLLNNGDFESVTEGKFDSWLTGDDYVSGGLPVVVSTSPVISGTYTALAPRGASTGSGMQQDVSTSVSNFTFSCDFSVLTGDGASRQSLVVMLNTGGSGDSKASFRIVDGGDGETALFQAYDRNISNWYTLTDFHPIPTPDEGTLREWDGETPLPNHLEIVCDWDAPTGATYDVTLNDVTVSGLDYF